jgi:hypothetical protein
VDLEDTTDYSKKEKLEVSDRYIILWGLAERDVYEEALRL